MVEVYVPKLKLAPTIALLLLVDGRIITFHYSNIDTKVLKTRLLLQCKC